MRGTGRGAERRRGRSLVLGAAVGLAAPLTLLACSSSDTTATSAPSTTAAPSTTLPAQINQGPTVEMTETNKFEPADAAAKAGQSVKWVNVSETRQHQVIQDVPAAERKFSAPVIQPGQEYIFTFTDPGAYPYVCAIHPNMTGTITVE